jgi:predicted nucleic acid-binding protein
MTPAFVDSSVLLAIALNEPGMAAVEHRLRSYTPVFSNDLIDAEVLAAFRRDGRELAVETLAPLRRVAVTRSLRPEIERVLAAGYVRGADCLHLATALYLTPDPAELTFLTLDERQRAVAEALGFAV